MQARDTSLGKFLVNYPRINDFARRILRLKKYVEISYYHFLRRNRVKERLTCVLPMPRNLYFEVTNICNASCFFCSYSKMKRKRMILDEGIFARTLEDYVDMGGTAVGLTPIVGDPFVDPNLFSKLDRIAAFPEIKNVGLVTNGILLTPEKSEKLLKYDFPFISILISLGGFDRGTYSWVHGVDKYESVVGNITYLIERKENVKPKNIKLTIGLRAPVNNREGPFYEFLCDCEKKGIIYIDHFIAGFDNFGGKIENCDLKSVGLIAKLQPVKKGACQTLFTKPIVMVDGRVGACAQRDLEGELEIGDLKEQTIQEILSGEKRRNLIEAHERGDFPEVCSKCSLYLSIYDPESLFWRDGLNWKYLR